MLDEITLDPIVASIAALLGVLLGIALGQLLLPGPRKAKRLAAEMEEMRREHAEYRERVSGHFHKTSDLIGQMTASYKAVYDHLSEGAQTLCADNAALPRGAFSSPRLIVDDTVEVSHEGVAAAARNAVPAQAVPANAATSDSAPAPPDVASQAPQTTVAPVASTTTPAAAPVAALRAESDAPGDAPSHWRFDVGGSQRADGPATAHDAVADAAVPTQEEPAPAPRATV